MTTTDAQYPRPIIRSLCEVFWGSHGCNLPPHETGQHLCDCCSPEHAPEHADADENDYGHDGCAGTWPYYGRAVMTDPDSSLWFFNHAFEKLPDEFDRLAAQPRHPAGMEPQ